MISSKIFKFEIILTVSGPPRRPLDTGSLVFDTKQAQSPKMESFDMLAPKMSQTEMIVPLHAGDSTR